MPSAILLTVIRLQWFIHFFNKSSKVNMADTPTICPAGLLNNVFVFSPRAGDVVGWVPASQVWTNMPNNSLSSVAHDATLTGSGTSTSPLAVANTNYVASVSGSGVIASTGGLTPTLSLTITPVTSVAAGDGSITIGGTSSAPTIKVTTPSTDSSGTFTPTFVGPNNITFVSGTGYWTCVGGIVTCAGWTTYKHTTTGTLVCSATVVAPVVPTNNFAANSSAAGTIGTTDLGTHSSGSVLGTSVGSKSLLVSWIDVVTATATVYYMGFSGMYNSLN